MGAGLQSEEPELKGFRRAIGGILLEARDLQAQRGGTVPERRSCWLHAILIVKGNAKEMTST